MEEQRFSTEYSNPVQDFYAPTSDEKTLGILAHALVFVAYFLAPLIIYLMKRDESKYVAEQAKESLNFQITWGLACFVLCITIIGIFVAMIIGVVAAVLVIVASVKASEGKIYRYPLTIKFVK